MQTPSLCSTTTTAIHLFHASMGLDWPLHPSIGDLRSLVHREMDWSGTSCVNEVRDRYWLAESFSKIQLELGIDRVAAARETFLRAEELCAEANIRLCDGLNKPSAPFAQLSYARNLIRQILGRFSWDDALKHCSFGPGATKTLPRRKANHSNKWLANDVTARCLPLCIALQQLNNGWSPHAPKYQVVAGNTVTTVPKNAKTDRTIAIEPTWNMFFQRGIGGMIRHRLNKRCGILQPSAQSDHREMAMWGSVTGNVATIDLKAASDSVSLALVELLLPEDWLNAILITRSETGTWDGQTISYEKVSSMGNGFTFELETLIFYALTRAVARDGTVSCYGDDIICPANRAEDVIALLTYCGFTVNEKKTHITGLFRESCGGHYFNGYEITPPYFREVISSPMSRIAAANALSARAEQRWGWARDGRFNAMHRFLSRGIKFFGPKESSGALHVPLDVAMAAGKLRWQKGLQQWSYREFQPVTEQQITNPLGGVWASLWGRNVTEEAYKRKFVRWRVGSSLAIGWEGPGPWI